MKYREILEFLPRCSNRKILKTSESAGRKVAAFLQPQVFLLPKKRGGKIHKQNMKPISISGLLVVAPFRIYKILFVISGIGNRIIFMEIWYHTIRCISDFSYIDFKLKIKKGAIQNNMLDILLVLSFILNASYEEILAFINYS